MESKKYSYRLGHRERLRQKFVDGKLADYELLEMLLTYAIPRCDVKPLAHQLMEKYGGLYGIITSSYQSLLTNKGVKENTAIFIKSIHEVMKRGLKNHLYDTPVFHNYDRLIDYCKLLLYGKPIEEFHILYLDSDHRLLSDDIHSTGTVDWAAVYPREILKRALDLNAASIVMLHNHPHGQTSFSSDDIEITTQVKNILQTVNIELFDHLLVSGDIVYSARNLFLIK